MYDALQCAILGARCALDRRYYGKCHFVHAFLSAPYQGATVAYVGSEGVLVLQTSMRVWDALLSEGAKILYRVALALLKTHEDRLMAQDNAGYVQREMKLASAGMHDGDALMKV